MKTLVFLVDAVNPKQAKCMAFLQTLHSAKIVSLLGYSTGIHPTIWTGKNQDEHGLFTTFYYDPKNSPFKWTKWLRLIPTHYLRKNILAGLKAPYFWFPRLRPAIPGLVKKKIIPLPPAIPVDVAPLFSDNSLTVPSNSLFDLMKRKRIKWKWQTDGKHEGEYRKLENMSLSTADVDLYYLYKADEFGHIHGPYSDKVKNYLVSVDSKIKGLFEQALKKHKKVNLVVFSDHGMCKVSKYIDVQKQLKKTSLVHGKDYIAFYDSTLARFWPADEKAKKIIIATLKKMQHMTFLDEKLLKKFGINFPDKTKYGEVIGLPDPETRIYPDYFAPIKGGIKGWHGFDPEFEDSKGVLFTNIALRKKEIKISEMFLLLKTALKV